jgi:hypothetical protein
MIPGHHVQLVGAKTSRMLMLLDISVEEEICLRAP